MFTPVRPGAVPDRGRPALPDARGADRRNAVAIGLLLYGLYTVSTLPRL
jgi:hypothetical protein